MKTVVVTGVSTGIGQATAQALLTAGYRVFGSVRRESDAAALAGPNFEPLVFDVTDPVAVQAGAAEVRAHLGGERLAGLVNNAGIAIQAPLLSISRADFSRQLDVNLLGPLIVTQAFAPLLGAGTRGPGAPGRIVNVGSTVGKLAPPFMGAYSASKHGLEAFTDSLRRELRLYGIQVSLVGPGPVNTPIFDKPRPSVTGSDFDRALARYDQLAVDSRDKAMRPEAIGRVIVKALTTRNPRARYAVVPGDFQSWMLWKVFHRLPKRWVDFLFARMLGLNPVR